MAQRDREECPNFVFFGDSRVGDKKVGDDRRGANHHVKLELKRISYACQFTISVMACTSPELQCNMADTRSFHHNLAHGTSDLLYLVVYSTSFSSSSTVSLFLFHI
jgi:hypothetical protein